jgi:hypothetical protein
MNHVWCKCSEIMRSFKLSLSRLYTTDNVTTHYVIQHSFNNSVSVFRPIPLITVRLLISVYMHCHFTHLTHINFIPLRTAVWLHVQIHRTLRKILYSCDELLYRVFIVRHTNFHSLRHITLLLPECVMSATITVDCGADGLSIYNYILYSVLCRPCTQMTK